MEFSSPAAVTDAEGEKQRPGCRHSNSLATSTPQLHLWDHNRHRHPHRGSGSSGNTDSGNRRDAGESGSVRRAVTFSENGRTAENYSGTANGSGGHEETKGDIPTGPQVLVSSGGNDSGGTQKAWRDADSREEQELRPDFLQLSYAMKTLPRDWRGYGGPVQVRAVVSMR